MVQWVASIEASLAVTWSVSPICWVANCWRSCNRSTSGEICSSIGIVSNSASNLSVPVGFCTMCSVTECNGGLPSYFVPVGPHPAHRWLSWLTSMYGPFWESCVQRILCLEKDTSSPSSEPTLKFLFWSGRVVPFRFHLFQKDHPQKDWWYLPLILL